MAEPTAFPLCWPSGWKRIPSSRRRDGLFKTNQRPVTVIEACNRVYDQLEMFGGSNVIISSNLLATQDNRPRSVKTVPDDPGVSVYWLQRGAQRCMAIDRYTTVAQNIAAIAATLDAMRAIDRHGGAEILDRAFSVRASSRQRLEETTGSQAARRRPKSQRGTGSWRARITQTRAETPTRWPPSTRLQDLRGTFLTQLIRAGVDIKTTQILARHSSERTTMKSYLRSDDSAQRGAIESLRDRLGLGAPDDIGAADRGSKTG